MQKKSQRLRVVLELAERKENAVMKELQKKRRYLDQQQTQLRELTAYQQQYIDSMKHEEKSKLTAQMLQTSQQFMSQICSALEQQQGIVQIAQGEFDRTSSEWHIAHEKRKGMFDLISRFRSEEEIEAEKRVQKQLESDFLANRFRR